MNNIIESMTSLVEKYVNHYKSDFYEHDLYTLNNAMSDKYIWILRNSGTWLFPEKEASNIYSYCLKHDGSVVGFYRLDLRTDTIKKINNPTPLKSFEVVYRNSNNVYIKHKVSMDAACYDSAELLAKKFMSEDYDYYEIRAV